MFDVLLSLSLSFAITFLSIPVIIRVAEMKKLFDVPDARKVHVTPIPSLGGLGIFAGFTLAVLLSVPTSALAEFQYFLAAGFIIFFLGIKDDILVLSPLKKFIGQLLAAFIIVYKGGVQIKSMHGFLGIYEMPEMFSLVFTYLTIIVIINSFNLIDGVDGLAGSLAFMTCALFGLYFLAVDLPNYAILAFSVCGALLAFLIFNFNPAKIFMGDTGSLLIGLITSILVIKFIDVADTAANYPIKASPAVGFSLMIVPLLDTLRVFSTRMLHRRSPFSPDRNHVHHLLLDWGFGHRAITYTLVGINILFVAAAFLLGNVISCTALLIGMVVIYYSAFAIAWYRRPKPRIFVTRKSDDSTEIITTKPSIFTITKEKLQ
ncbi:MAG TPA: MraY family glycosyltransferase [Parasegetibacter sp.]|jgi:UDP-GlcNAc:undecaprenyl-phosphate GlcNAc-1-phosphate transferase